MLEVRLQDEAFDDSASEVRNSGRCSGHDQMDLALRLRGGSRDENRVWILCKLIQTLGAFLPAAR